MGPPSTEFGSKNGNDDESSVIDQSSGDPQGNLHSGEGTLHPNDGDSSAFRSTGGRCTFRQVEEGYWQVHGAAKDLPDAVREVSKRLNDSHPGDLLYLCLEKVDPPTGESFEGKFSGEEESQEAPVRTSQEVFSGEASFCSPSTLPPQQPAIPVSQPSAFGQSGQTGVVPPGVGPNMGTTSLGANLNDLDTVLNIAAKTMAIYQQQQALLQQQPQQAQQPQAPGGQGRRRRHCRRRNNRRPQRRAQP